jgi:WD40 repeat protein
MHVPATLSAVRFEDGSSVLSTGEDGRVCIIDATGVLRERARVPGKWATAAVGDAERLAYASGRTVWLETQRSRRTLLHERSVKGLALSEDGSLLAVVQADRVSVHDARLEDTDAEPLQLEWKDVHLAATFSPDLRFIVVASQACGLHGWRIADRRHFRMLGYPERVTDWSWSPDGSHLATSGPAGAVIWSFEGADGPMHRQAVELGERGDVPACAVAWHPAERSLAIGYADGAIGLAALDPTEVARTVVQPSPAGAVACVTWSGDGRQVAFGTAGGVCGVAGATA